MNGQKTITGYSGGNVIEETKEPTKRKPQFKLAIVTSVRLTESEWSDLVDEADRQELKPSALIRIMVKKYIMIAKLKQPV